MVERTFINPDSLQIILLKILNIERNLFSECQKLVELQECLLETDLLYGPDRLTNSQATGLNPIKRIKCLFGESNGEIHASSIREDHWREVI